ncbi:MAG: helix-hairpin-helix domain-containing protein [Ignavibacteria bacterium]|nr:helix-hairpin-helix domain-containing protein [Ignavibacteria bacterium]
MLKKLSEKIGFTQTEIKVILFLIVVFLVGAAYSIVTSNNKGEYINFDYSEQDSLFLLYKENFPKGDNSPNASVDIKAEVLELKSLDFEQNKKPPLPQEKSININTAGANQFISLPGIGEKTAKKIILLRDEKGGFKNLEELMDVRGIGEVKFNKIKKFLYIE